MPVTLEEEIVLLFALYNCGRSPSKGRAIQFILTHNYLREREGDEDAVSTGESRTESHGFVRISARKNNWTCPSAEHGRSHPQESSVSKGRHCYHWGGKTDDILGSELMWRRFSDEFLRDLKDLGRKLKAKQEAEQGAGEESPTRPDSTPHDN